MPRRGPGSKCSPASSPALSYSTGLRLGPSWGSPVDLVLPSPAMCAAALIVLALYFLVASIVCWLWSNLSAALVGKLLLVAASVTRGSHSTNLFLLAAGVALLYGGEFLEVIRFMEPETAELEPAEKEYVQQLAAAVGALQRVPLVTKVSLFDKPGNLNETGVRVNLYGARSGKRRLSLCAKSCTLPGGSELRRLSSFGRFQLARKASSS